LPENEIGRSKPGAALVVSECSTRVYPREVVLKALHHHAAAVVLAHNHPSGTVQPSRADEALTQTLKAALALVDVRVLDHVVVAPGQALSMAEKGLL
jgi:DNA repair protein RadC